MKKDHEIILDGLIEKPAMKLVGKKFDCTLDEKYNYQNITELWRSFNAELSSINERLNKDKWQKLVSIMEAPVNLSNMLLAFQWGASTKVMMDSFKE